MRTVLKKLIGRTSVQKLQDRKRSMYHNLIHYEAKIGGQLFGTIPKGARREFFCLDEHTWVWYEEGVTTTGKPFSSTTRYDVRPNGVLKSKDGQAYQQVNPREAEHLRQAANLYYQRVSREIYAGL
jgi:hypothetical protein